jgi:hypothetical protein
MTMHNTERLYAARDEASHQLDCIRAASKKAYAEIEGIAARLREETGCTEDDVQYFLDHAHDGLRDMLAGVTDRYEDERDGADEEISLIEEADLRRSAPVVL